MLRMSKLADYGTVVMTSLARSPDRAQSAADVALATGLGLPTVSKLLKTFARQGLVVSTRGASGGYLLVRAPGEISVAQMIAAIEGRIGITECSSAPGMCAQERVCSVRGNWRTINRVVLGALEQISLEQMARPMSGPVAVSAIGVPQTRRRASAADQDEGAKA